MGSIFYKENLIQTLLVLCRAENELFTAMVNLGLSGEYDSISKLYGDGEVLNLELAMFENTSDQNLNILSELVKNIIQIKTTLMNNNAINEEDLSST